MRQERARLLKRLQERLPKATREAVNTAVSLAEERGVALYLVGGGVRDLLLEKPQLDVDLVVEGGSDGLDALGLATAVGAALRARVVTHPRFGTAVVQGEEVRLDLAQARSERYARPGALPSVRQAGLIEDLGRRDFTINAMALRLGGPGAGELIDLHGGRDDLGRRLVRVLHDASFQDDATRMFRALRYAGRLEFRLEEETESRLRRDLAYLESISGARLRHELERIAREERAAEILCLASKLGVMEAVHPSLRTGEQELRGMARLSAVAPSHRNAVMFCLLLAGSTATESKEAIARLALTGRQAEAVRGLLTLRTLEAKLTRAPLRPSEVVGLLSSQPLAAIEAFALIAGRPPAAERARRYLDEWRFVRPRMHGREPEAIGVEHGPDVGET
ncbi:MAG: CCA tRNA nucleotidyltransferase, partial [Gemmatimonadetes bacterium]|nr:CCA tRNA nucleotidyltransferase [Gemmatimonadota bacterium]